MAAHAITLMINALHTRGYVLADINGTPINRDEALMEAGKDLLPDQPILSAGWGDRALDFCNNVTSRWVLAGSDELEAIDKIRAERRARLCPWYKTDWRKTHWGQALGYAEQVYLVHSDDDISLGTAESLLTGHPDGLILLYKKVTPPGKAALRCRAETWKYSVDLAGTPFCVQDVPALELVDDAELARIRSSADKIGDRNIDDPVSRFLGLPNGSVTKAHVSLPGMTRTVQYRTTKRIK